MVVMLLGLTVQAQELKTYDQFFLEAMIQREKGNNDAAFDLLRHCQELNPDAPEVYEVDRMREACCCPRSG